MNKELNKWLLSLVLISLSSIAQADTNEDQINELLHTYEVALNGNETKAVMYLYGDNSVFMPQNAPAFIGKEAVNLAYQHVFKTLDLNVRFTVHELEIHGDTAWARTSSAGKTKVLAAGITVNEGNNELFIFKQVNGEWKIHQYLFATNKPRK